MHSPIKIKSQIWWETRKIASTTFNCSIFLSIHAPLSLSLPLPLAAYLSHAVSAFHCHFSMPFRASCLSALSNYSIAVRLHELRWACFSCDFIEHEWGGRPETRDTAGLGERGCTWFNFSVIYMLFTQSGYAAMCCMIYSRSISAATPTPPSPCLFRPPMAPPLRSAPPAYLHSGLAVIAPLSFWHFNGLWLIWININGSRVCPTEGQGNNTHTGTHRPHTHTYNISNEIKAIMRQQSARIAIIRVNKYTAPMQALSPSLSLSLSARCWHTSLPLSLSHNHSISFCFPHVHINKIRNAIKENNVSAIAFGFAFVSADAIHEYIIYIYIHLLDICILCARRIHCHNLLADVSDFTFHSPSIRHNHYALIRPSSALIIEFGRWDICQLTSLLSLPPWKSY